MQFGKARLPVLLETEDACNANGFSPIASLYLPHVLTYSAFSFNFWDDERAKKMMQMLNFCGRWFLGRSFSTGIKTMAGPIIVSALLLCFFLRLFPVFFLLWFFRVPRFCSSFSPGFFSALLRWFGVFSWRWIIRLTNACSFPALHLRFENKGKAGLLSFCSLPISLFLGPLSVFVHALHWPVSSALFF